MKKLRLSHPTGILKGAVRIGGSKSISNRALMLFSLAGLEPENYLQGLATARDTVIMQRLLSHLSAGHFDAEDAGTAFRFMAARLAIVQGVHVLTGSKRMQERPVGPLVEALRQLGVEVEYLGNEGFPPLRILGLTPEQITQTRVRISGNMSSQFISALVMIGAVLPSGLVIEVLEPRVSWSYVQMTLELLNRMSVEKASITESVEHGFVTLQIPGTKFTIPHLRIEPDWSSATYWLSMAALSKEADITLLELQMVGSVQGDSGVVKHFERLGLAITQEKEGVRILKRPDATPKQVLTIDFTTIPDTAQTLAVCCAALGVSGVFRGLETLAIKETDRILALKTELKKLGVTFSKMPAHMSKKGTQYLLDGKAEISENLEIETYGDHRMAMSFAPLALLGKPITLADSEIVAKSYPSFWADLEQLGFQTNEICEYWV
jgi:3-phosphoshikimate 1-carboxyvinyltransferase